MPIPIPKVRPQLFPDQKQASKNQKENWEETKNGKNKTAWILCISLEHFPKTDIQRTY